MKRIKKLFYNNRKLLLFVNVVKKSNKFINTNTEKHKNT